MNNFEIETIARQRFSGAYPDSLARQAIYERYHKFYSPAGGDQWPEDTLERPGKLHITANIIRPFVDTEARLLSLMPRITLPPPTTNDPDLARRAEATEKLFSRYLRMSGDEQWMFTFQQIKALYGMGVLKPFWNTDTKSPDVIVVEQPQNLMLGWGDSEFISIDWSIYHYKISRLQAKLRYPEISDEVLRVGGERLMKAMASNSHADPLQQQQQHITRRQETEYEQAQVTVWDYWYLDDEGKVMNAILINGVIVDGPHVHNEMPAIPYIPVEHDHEPGSPDGRGTAELLLDIQDGLNRAFSHYAQYIWDNTDPAYQLVGEDAPTTVPPGLVPRAGELSAPGPRAKIELINQGINNFPFDALIASYWMAAHRITGLSEVLFGQSAGSQTSARALNMQLESSINRLDPKRRRSYQGITTLLMFWHHMLEKMNPKIDGIPVKEVIKGLNNWKIVAPEITPRDVREHTMNVIDKLNAKTLSLQSVMDELGVENPLEEMDRIRSERSDAQLFPGDAQAIAAVAATLQALGMQEGAQGAAAQGTAEQDAAMSDRQEAQPSLTEGDNQLPTGAGMPPGEGGELIGGSMRPIVRQNPEGESMPMSEMRLPVTEF